MRAVCVVWRMQECAFKAKGRRVRLPKSSELQLGMPTLRVKSHEECLSLLTIASRGDLASGLSLLLIDY